ncbi:MAG: NUDIX hydrolase [Candidatus Diapherotrites archaeon]|nr:NUDIX hydrolase [Candidatus Diapherotrites archaeon]
MDSEKRPKVGVGVLIRNNGKILFGKRKGAHGEGTWAPPGGHLEFGESIEDCALREVVEEAGIKIKPVESKSFTNDFFEKEQKHYITLFMVCDFVSGTPKLLEPEKCEKWEWFSWNELPKPLFLTIQNLKKQGFDPFRL